MNTGTAPEVEVYEESAGRRYHSVTTILDETYPRPHLSAVLPL